MNEWERKVTKQLDDSEYHFLAEYDRWLRTAFTQIPLGGGEHEAHNFSLAVHQRLSSIVSKHSAMAFTMGQTAGDDDCKAVLETAQKKLADLPTINFQSGTNFTPHDAIAVLQARSIQLAGDVESSIVSGVKAVLLRHITGLPRSEAEQEIAKLLDVSMNRASLIVTTETTYAYNHGRLIQYRTNGADYVRFSAVMDGRTCGICASRNGLVAPIDAIGGDTPPVHGRCRCVLTPVFSNLQPDLMTPTNLDWSRVQPLPKGWIADDAPRASGQIFRLSA